MVEWIASSEPGRIAAGETGEAKFLADVRKHQIGVRFGDEARLTEANARTGDCAGRQTPHGMSDLIAAANGVIPGREPHLQSRADRVRDVQQIAETKSAA